jgi:hypothetical protein
MIKSILRLLAASTSFVALLLITNSAIAAAPVDLARIESPQLNIVNLNVISPALQLAGNENISEHLGCSCGLCTQSINQISHRI